MKEFIKEIAYRFGLQSQKYNIQNSQDILLKRCIDFFQIDLIVDAGANISQYATGVRKHGCVKQLFSFEPLISAFDKLRIKSVKDGKWEVFNLGVGSSGDQLTINVSENLVSSFFCQLQRPVQRLLPNLDLEVHKLSRLLGWTNFLLTK
jgi:FkbM family methyltransferase